MPRRHAPFILAATCLSLLAGGCAEYRPMVTDAFVTLGGPQARVTVAFSDGDHKALLAWHQGRSTHAGKGKKRGHNPHGDVSQLPPGIRKQLARGKGLPPGLKKQRLPNTLEQHLSPLPDGYARFRIGTDFVIMDLHANLVVDLIKT